MTFLFEASSGNTVADKLIDEPTMTSASEGSIVTPVTARLKTFTVHVPVKPPSSVVTVMTVSPTETPVTTPFASTVAMRVSADSNDTFLLYTFSGSTL